MVFVLLIFAFLFYFRQQIEGPAGSSDSKAEVKITEGQSVAEISDKLQGAGLIKSSWSFQLYFKFKKLTVKPGDYLMPQNLNEIQLAGIFSKGEHQVIRITIPEGWRREQIATYLADHTKINPDEFMLKTENLEGKLFPDTYDLTDQPTADEVIKKMTDDYDSRTSGLSVSSDAIIIASIVEREAANDTDRANIAGVFTNRQKIGMKYESDVTVQYQKDTNDYPSTGLTDFKFWKALSPGDNRKIPGPYNTYLNSGLPPTPICNPGLKSIEATLTPAKHDYYYFLYGSDGKLHLAKTQTEQNANVAKYL